MVSSFKHDVQKLAATLPSWWRDDHRREVAQAILLTNTVHEVNAAYDSAIGNMLRGGYRNGSNEVHQDPMLSKYGPNGSNGNRQRGVGGSGAELPNPEQLLNMLQLCLSGLRENEDEKVKFLQGLADLLDANVNAQTEERLFERLNGSLWHQP